MTILLTVLLWVLPPQAEAPAPQAPRLPEPPAEEQKKALETIRRLFEPEYARRAPAEQVAFASRLLEAGRQTRNDPASKYVLFLEAREIAVQGGGPEPAFQAIAELERSFDIDARDLRVSAVTGLSKTARGPAASKFLVQEGLREAEDLLARDDGERAVRVLAALEGPSRAAGDPGFPPQVQARLKEARARQAEYRKVEPAFRALKENPSDPDACLAAGKYLCWIRGDWEAGLPLLARGADAELRSLAAADLGTPADAVARMGVADGWFRAASRLSGAEREGVLRRAVVHYQQALPDLQGMAKLRVEKQLETILQGLSSGVSAPAGAALALSFNRPAIVERGGRRYARDLSGNGLDAEIVGGEIGRGPLGEALILDGAGQYAVVPAHRALDAGGGAVTIACWVRLHREIAGETMILEHGVWPAPDAWQLTFMNARLLRFNFPALHAQGGAIDAAVDFAPGEWRHVAGTYDGRSGAIYVDGKRAAARPAALPLPAGQSPVYIGSRGGRGLFLPGAVDEMVVCLRVLGEAEIRALAGAGRRR